MRKNEDILWKGILEDVFDDFLRFLTPGVEKVFDFDKGFEFLDKELEQVFPPENDEYSPKVIDKLVKVFTRGGEEEWILVHVEVQAQCQKDFARRMFTYFYRILDKYRKPITAYAIFTGAGTTARPDSFEIEYMGTSLRYTFNTYKIADQQDEELQASDNPFALVVLMARAALAGRDIKDGGERDELLLALKLKLARALLAKRIPGEKVRVLMNFLRYYVRFENPEVNLKFDKEVEIITGRSTTMGIEELLLERAEKQGLQKGIKRGIEKGLEKGIEKGIEQGKHQEAIAIAVEMKKNGYPVSAISQLTKLPADEIEKL